MAVLMSAVAGLVAAVAPGPAAAAPAQGSPSTPVLDVASVSPWVEPDGEFRVRFAPTDTLPPGAQLTVTIHQALASDDDTSLREQLVDLAEGAAPGPILQPPGPPIPLALLGPPESGSELAIPIRSRSADSERVLIPVAGIHPVGLIVTSADGPELWRETVFLNRLPEPDRDRPDPVPVSLVLPVDSTPSLAVNGTPAFSPEERALLADTAALLERAPGAPVTLAVRPNTLQGVAELGEPWARSLLESVSDPATGSLAGLTYTDVDLDGLVAAGAAGLIGRQALIGALTMNGLTGREVDPSTWLLDGGVDGRSLEVLASLGVRTVLVPADAVAPEGDVERVDVMTRPFSLEVPGEDAPTDVLAGLAYDSVVSDALDAVGVSPGTRAHRATTLLLASWFGASSTDGSGPAAAVIVGPDTGAETLELLASTLGAGGPLEARPDGPLRGRDPVEAPDATLIAAPAPDLSGAVASFEESATAITGYRSMVGDDDPGAALWSVLNDESLATGLSPAGRAALHAAIEGGVAANVAQVELPRPREVILASEDTTIPLRFSNGLPVEVRMVLRARSPRLDVGMDGTTEIVLAPGDNRVDVPVTVRASGQTLLRLSLTSPDGSIPIGSVDVPVRSTGISGVGAALSIISALFLVGWWFRTHRRRRRADHDGPENDDSTPDDSTPDDAIVVRGGSSARG